MPLRDHFRPPMSNLASWEEVHGAWPGVIAFRLNDLLPPEFRSGVKIHLGSLVEVDVGAFERENAGTSHNGSDVGAAIAWQAAAPTLLLDTDELTPPEYEVRVYDVSESRRLVAAVEIVSPCNKDRASARDAFVSKCHALLQEQVCVVIVDPVTERGQPVRRTRPADRGGAACHGRRADIRRVLSNADRQTVPGGGVGTHADRRCVAADAPAMDQRVAVRPAGTGADLRGHLPRSPHRVTPGPPAGRELRAGHFMRATGYSGCYLVAVRDAGQLECYLPPKLCASMAALT